MQGGDNTQQAGRMVGLRMISLYCGKTILANAIGDSFLTLPGEESYMWVTQGRTNRIYIA